MDLSEEAIKYVKDNKKKILSDFVNEELLESRDVPVSFFMAGSPGAGKTEFSKNWVKLLDDLMKSKKSSNFKIARIDPDEIRSILPGYNGKNSNLFQDAVSLVVNKIYDFVLTKKYNILLDGTFSKFDQAKNNIERSLRKNREVHIFYVYQDPIKAWEFSKKREILEGRKIELDVFVEEFFSAKDSVDKIKEHYGKRVVVDLIKKDYQNKVEKIFFNVSSITRLTHISDKKKKVVK